MSKQHRAVQTQGHRVPSPAKVGADTTSTYGGVAKAPRRASGTSSTYAGVAKSYSDTAGGARSGEGPDVEIIPAPPVARDERDKPLTLGHLNSALKVGSTVIAMIGVFGAGTWWVSTLSSKVEHHEEAIRDGKGKTEKLLNDSAISAVKLQRLDTQVGKLEEKVFEQAQARISK